MASILETIPGALTKKFMRKKLEVIHINDTITREYAQEIVELINKAVETTEGKKKYIFIYIHCVGGSIYEGFRIINAIERAKRYCIVATVVDSIAFSTAVAIFCAGNDGFRFVSPYAQVMLHDPRCRPHSAPLATTSSLAEHSASSTYNPSPSALACHTNHHHLWQEEEKTSHHHPWQEETTHHHLWQEEEKLQGEITPHIKRVQKQVIGAILNALKNKDPEVVKTFLRDMQLHGEHDWFLDANDMLHYGLADYASVPDFVHHIEYRPMLILDGEKMELT